MNWANIVLHVTIIIIIIVVVAGIVYSNNCISSEYFS